MIGCGEDTNEGTYETTDGLKLVQRWIRFKGFTFLAFDPPEHLANEDKSIKALGSLI